MLIASKSYKHLLYQHASLKLCTFSARLSAIVFFNCRSDIFHICHSHENRNLESVEHMDSRSKSGMTNKKVNVFLLNKGTFSPR
jgi:hypothetical protein